MFISLALRTENFVGLYVIQCVFITQMLLCVGSFFGTNEESKKEWETYSSGSVAGAIYTVYLTLTCAYTTCDLSSRSR